VDDLQFAVEEATIDEGDLRVSLFAAVIRMKNLFMSIPFMWYKTGFFRVQSCTIDERKQNLGEERFSKFTAL
jgi:hypothetical protein